MLTLSADMNVEALLVEETPAGWRTQEMMIGPSPLPPMNAWNSKSDSVKANDTILCLN